jgi:hypothetical protein
MLAVRIVYVTLVILALVGFFVAYYRGPILFYIYGFDPALYGGSSMETFIAYEKTALAASVVYRAAIVLAILTFSFSAFLMYLKVFTTYYFAHVVCLISFVLLLIYAFAYTMPKRVF